MNDALFVGELDRIADLAQNLEVPVESSPRIVRTRGRIVHHHRPSRAFDALHDEHRGAVLGLAQGIDGHDVRMLEPARDPRFLEELLHRLRGASLRPNGLGRHLAIQGELRGFAHQAHAPLADGPAHAQTGGAIAVFEWDEREQVHGGARRTHGHGCRVDNRGVCGPEWADDDPVRDESKVFGDDLLHGFLRGGVMHPGCPVRSVAISSHPPSKATIS